jgi:hypothetical protein
VSIRRFASQDVIDGGIYSFLEIWDHTVMEAQSLGVASNHDDLGRGYWGT